MSNLIKRMKEEVASKNLSFSASNLSGQSEITVKDLLDKFKQENIFNIDDVNIPFITQSSRREFTPHSSQAMGSGTSTWKCISSSVDLQPSTWYCGRDRKSTRLNSSHVRISYAVFCLKKKKKKL